jgi:hypothetical protein
MSETFAVGWLLRTALGGGLILLLTRLLMGLTRSPARRQRQGEWGVAAALVLAGLALAPAWLSLPLLPAPSPASPAAPVAKADDNRRDPPNSTAGAEAAPEAEWAWVPPALPEQPQPPAAPTPAPPGRSMRAEVEPAPSAPDGAAGWTWDGVARIVLAAYALAGGLLLGRWLLGYVGLWWLLRRTEAVPPTLARLFADMTHGRRARLVLAPGVRVPFSFGLWRPTVVLPAALGHGAPEGVLRWVLAHELSHLERRDAWGGLLLALGQGAYFYLPWFWWLRRQVRLCQEYVADAAAVSAAGGPAADYAQFLLSWNAVPPPPAAGTGVCGSNSDLYRRITMLLQTKAPEGRCPRRWSLTFGCGLLALAVLAAGVRLRAAAADEDAPKKDKAEAQKKEEPKKKDEVKKSKKRRPGAAWNVDVEELLKSLQGAGKLDEKQAKELRKRLEEAQKRMQEAFKKFEGFQGLEGLEALQRLPQMGGLFQGKFRPGMAGLGRSHARLGVGVQPPSETLADQLDLPKGQGLVLREVGPNSAAAKAGLKPHDILLELAGKTVSNNPAEFVKQVKDIPADKPVNAVVLRKGKKETIKGLKLPEAKAERGGLGGGQFRNVVPKFEFNFQPPNADGKFSMTSLRRNGDEFTATQREAGASVTVRGRIEKGKANVSQISVREGGAVKEYAALDKVPEKYKARVKDLVDMAEKGAVRAKGERDK